METRAVVTVLISCGNCYCYCKRESPNSCPNAYQPYDRYMQKGPRVLGKSNLQESSTSSPLAKKPLPAAEDSISAASAPVKHVESFGS